MKRILVVLVLLASIVGCEVQEILSPPTVERPTVNLPLSLRQENWTSSRGFGSCTWATMVSLLRWQGQPQAAEWVRKNCAGGGTSSNMAAAFDRAGLRYAYTTDPDVSVLEWACQTRRGCGISVKGMVCPKCGKRHGGYHFVALVYLDDKWAAILDNNAVEQYVWIPREELIATWKAGGGWTFTPVYDPAAPLP